MGWGSVGTRMLEEWDGDGDAEGMGWNGEGTRMLKERSRDTDEDRMVMPMQEVWRHKRGQGEVIAVFPTPWG